MPASGTGDVAEGDPAAALVELSTPSRRLLPGKHLTSGPNYRQELFCEIPNPHGTAQDWEQIYLRRGLLFPALPFPPAAHSSRGWAGKPQHGAGADGMQLLMAGEAPHILRPWCGCTAPRRTFPETPESTNKTGHTPRFILVFNCTPKHNTAVKCPNNME